MEKLTLEDFKEMDRIEKAQGFTHLAPELCFEIYKKFPETFCVLKKGNKVIGHICTLPLEKSMYDKIKNNKAREWDIAIEHISVTNPVYFYLSMLVIEEAHRNFANLLALVKQYKRQMSRLITGGMVIGEIVSDLASEYGYKMGRMFGMKHHLDAEHGIIHTLDGKSFVKFIL